jgi:glycerol uptake facilitator-like aquaporin
VGGLLVGFPLLAAVCSALGKSLGGPSVDLGTTELSAALLSEAGASACLTTVIGLLAMTRIGDWFWVKQPAIAMCVRLIATRPFWSTGPAMNPMLPTSFAVYANGACPEWRHFAIYWAAALASATTAAAILDKVIGISQPAAPPPEKKKKKKKA